MATKKQISDLIKYAINNDKERLFDLSKEIIRNEKNPKIADEIHDIIRFGETQVSPQGKLTMAETTVLPDKDSREFLYQILHSEYRLKELVLPPQSKKKLSRWIQELKNISFLSGFKIPLETKGIFYGPTGTGKTMAAYCIAHELNKPLFIVNLSSIISSKLGETSRNLNYVFQVAQERDAILFLDELDFFAMARDSIQDHGEARRALLSLLQILDLIPQDLIVIAATNLIESVDPSILRRFGFRLEFKIPTKHEIETFITQLKESYKLPINNRDLPSIAHHFSKHSYGDIRNTMLGALKLKLIVDRDTRNTKKIQLTLKDIKEFGAD